MSAEYVKIAEKQIRQLELERDTYLMMMIDEVQFNRGISREKAEQLVEAEFNQRRQLSSHRA